MADIEVTTLGTRELWEQLQSNPAGMYRDAADQMKERGLKEAPTLTRVLEFKSPSEKDSRIDAFGRLMQEAGIITRSDPMAGYWASPATDFLKNPGTRALMTEFFCRQWRKVSFATPQQRAILMSSDFAVGTWQSAWSDAMTARMDTQIAPAIPLSDLVAMTTPIDGDAYRTSYLTYDAAAVRMYRVGETAEIPRAVITAAEHTIRLLKYGRGIEASYEQMRRMRTDKFALFVQWMAVQSEIDKVVAAINVLVNGDGNSNTAATSYNLTTLDPLAVAGTLTLAGWWSFLMKFTQPYIPTTALATAAIMLQLFRLNTGSANVPLAQAPLNMGRNLIPINQTADGLRVGWTDDAPANKILALDRRFALERVTEIGASIQEVERFANRQTEALFVTETEGFGSLDKNAVKILNVAA